MINTTTTINQDTDITRVIFRRFNRSHGGDLIAIFPDLPGSMNPYTCSSYQWLGQHSSCDYANLLQITKPVKMLPNSQDEREVKSFINHLECEIGYNLKVITKMPQDSLELRKQAII